MSEYRNFITNLPEGTVGDSADGAPTSTARKPWAAPTMIRPTLAVDTEGNIYPAADNLGYS